MRVIAECVDIRDGKRYFPDDDFPNPTPEQVARLKAAGCLTDVKRPSSEASSAAADKAAADKAAADKAAADKAGS